MKPVTVFDLLGRRALVTRSSARGIADALESAVQDNGANLVVDFQSVDAVSPSFIDELVAVVIHLVASSGSGDLQLLFENVPTRMSRKFTAIGRDLEMIEAAPGTWRITRSESAATEV